MNQVAAADLEAPLDRQGREPEEDELDLLAGGAGDNAMRPARRRSRLVAENVDQERDLTVGRRGGEVGQRLRRDPCAWRMPEQIETARVLPPDEAGKERNRCRTSARQLRGRREKGVETRWTRGVALAGRRSGRSAWPAGSFQLHLHARSSAGARGSRREVSR